MIVIHGQPATKKNSPMPVFVGGDPCPICQRRKKAVILPSAAYKKYAKVAKAQLLLVSRRYSGPVEVTAQYWLRDRRRPDLNNLMAATADILQEAHIIQDDRDIISWDGSRIAGVDRENPRVEITIREVDG